MPSSELDHHQSPGGERLIRFAGQHAIIFAAVAIFLLPTIFRIATQSWSTEAGAHGPIVLATGIWLLFQCDFQQSKPQCTDPVRDSSARFYLFIVLEVLVLAIYAFGRAYDFLSIEAGAAYLALLVVTATFVGIGPLSRNAFPLFYLSFLIPIPGWLIDRATAPLQQLISHSATSLLQMLDYPVMRSGVTIHIAQYQLLVEQACSGMNSLVGLISVTLFYIYVLHRASWKYAAMLILLILPVSLFVNFLRVVALILLTYHYGDAAAQGFLHGSAGIALFTLALFVMIGLDALLRRTLFRDKDTV